ncbi:MAG: aspartyl/glutamyl-tRNA amidotransferase subunit B [Elusimicrobia bacterium RIFOXYA2_FULL_50_26]|nr:MAG: aspartyl/glutamyl-tRNA amidotransferase subunit B [Elusimicrobia bacterium RIFOXYA2_FULL_50_26]OGS23720.1 MAG: aspartyl/glutamyl-tRNA amidotransferase subunit B [Elusimicrobia bacterium RIFOXYB2_FULL_50_12]
MKYEAVIGLEVHARLKTNSKIFCSCPSEFGAAPNLNICPVCTGQPGTLPVLNEKAVEYIVRTGLALGCAINRRSVFARKQYFYPDLPKNYQISQYELPVCGPGFVEIESENGAKKIGVTRIHLEEDAGKLLHAIGARELDYSLADYNRTGVPLMEIVSDPDMHSPQDAFQYLSALKNILEYIGVCDCNMEEGKFRCDANVSIRPEGREKLGTKVELKNMNSLSGVRDAIAFEIERQTEALSSGGVIVQETRLWDTERGVTVSMRAKEEAHDYRYFPEPDLVPIDLDERRIEEISRGLPELPAARKVRFISKMGLSEYDAGVMTADKALADYYEAALRDVPAGVDAPKTVSNWISTELLGRLNAANKTIHESPVTPPALAGLITLITNATISGKMAKAVFDEMFSSGRPAGDIVKERGLVQISDEGAVEKLCDEAIAENPKAVAEFKSGKERALGSLVGAVMKKSSGRANPQLANKILKQKLS